MAFNRGLQLLLRQNITSTVFSRSWQATHVRAISKYPSLLHTDTHTSFDTDDVDILEKEDKAVKSRSAYVMEEILETIKHSKRLYGIKPELWTDVEAYVETIPKYTAKAQWKAQVLFYLAQLQTDGSERVDFELGKSLFEYGLEQVEGKGIFQTTGLLLSYLQFCTSFPMNDKMEALLLDIYGKLCEVSDVFDSTSCRIIIKALSRTKQWRKCEEYIEMALEASLPMTYLYSPFVSAAVRNGESELAFQYMDKLAANHLIPDDEIYDAFLVNNNEALLEKFLLYCSENKTWFPSRKIAAKIIMWFERSACISGSNIY